MNLTIEKENNAEWQKTILSYKKEFPFFVIPHVIESIQNENKVSNKIVYSFNLNRTILATTDFSNLTTIGFEVAKDNIIASQSEKVNTEPTNIIEPLSGSDFYSAQGIKVSNEMPDKGSMKNDTAADNNESITTEDSEQSLLVQMSFSEWLTTITEKNRKEKEDLQEQANLKNIWKKQKLTDAIQEENDEIPEQVFQMAVDSIEREDALVSESLAEVYRLQGKYEQAISMYKKLILLNPKKRVYFADKIEQIQKNT